MAEDIASIRTTRSASICVYDVLDVKPSIGSLLSVSADVNLHKKELDQECGNKILERKTTSTQRHKRAMRSQSAKMSNSHKSSRPNNSSRASTNKYRYQSCHVGGSIISPHCISEPKLTNENMGCGIRKRDSRRGQSMHHIHHQHVNTLDVRNGKNRYDPQSKIEENCEGSNYRLRSFSLTSKGLINRGDSFRRKPSKSSSLPHSKKTGDQNEPKLLKEILSYTVGMLGGPGVGKTALISQFMTSECINAYDRQRDESKEESVFVMLNGEETELKFANITDLKAQFEKDNQPDAYIIMYSVIDKVSFQQAEELLSKLHVQNVLRIRPAILVGNKIDLVRSRAVTFQDGKYSAYTYHAKFIEISVGINHNVDELLVGVLHQIRLKRQICNHPSNAGELEKITKSNHWYKSKSMMRATVKAHRVLTWLFKKDDNKFKNCENLHVL
ncbi:GTP-binding protein REM 1 isoform X2 [Microplitis mediator]|uniref:GTP-binding protein REM 1 isoform X2 n=1 Tax=Microplitis mediator TaxID=375433 RepID=UPI002553AA0B|nr:GTP-binding protein REM 1 isoform X2 [Microplitis mediator]XP_057320284.1 GTP-binding protein REM 1 isoform X2 [Microplitis mediator]